MPTISVDDPFLSMFTQCCVDTHFAHTLYSYSSGLQWVKGRHSIKFGGEQRVFFNNFWQPDNPTGIFNFSRDVTTSQPNNSLGDDDHRQGNPFATILTGYAHDASLHLVPAVADKSKETAFYVQDDWKVTPKLTVNIGLRYEWSTPYTERYNRLQFNDFTGDTGISIPVDRDALGTVSPVWADWGNQGHLGVSNFQPSQLTGGSKQFCSAFRICLSTRVQHGAAGRRGNLLRNERRHQLPVRRAGICEDGEHVFHQRQFRQPSTRVWDLRPSSPTVPAHFPPAWRLRREPRTASWRSGASGTRAIWTPAPLAMRRSTNGTSEFSTCLPGQIVIGVDYSANRSTHLPWAGAGGISTRNRNFLPSSVAQRAGSDV